MNPENPLSCKSLEPISLASLKDLGRITTKFGEQEGVQKSAAVATQFKSPTADQIKALALKRNVPWEDGMADRAIPFWGSDERVDRDGDIVLQNWDMSEFQKNAVMPWNHNWMAPPIGTYLDWEVIKRSDSDYRGNALAMLGVFADEKASPLADQIFRLTKAGYIKSVSVGFAPTEAYQIKDKAEREKLGQPQHGVVIARAKLLECSPCTIPANPGAHTIIRSAQKSGLLRENDHLLLREMQRTVFLRSGDKARWQEYELSMGCLWKDMFPKAEFIPNLDLEAPMAEVCKQFRELVEKVNSADKTIDLFRRELSDLKSNQPAPPVAGLDVLARAAENARKYMEQ